MGEQIVYDVSANADLSELQQVIQGIRQMAGSLEDVAQEQRELRRSAEQAAEAEEEMAEAARGIKTAWQGIKALGIAGIIAAIAGGVKEGYDLTSDWVLAIDDLAARFGLSNEAAAQFATSWTLAGVSIEEGTAAIEAFTGRLFQELEKQKEIAEAINEIGKGRAKLAADLAAAEADHMGKLSELEAQRAEIQNANFDEVNQKRDRQLAELSRDYQRHLEDQTESERQETDRLEEEWRDRARKYERAFEDLRSDFSDKARRARNFKEFREAEAEFRKKQARLTEDQQQESEKSQSTAERRIAEAQRAGDREKELFEEKKLAILAGAEEETQKLAERQAEQLVAVEKRIAAENDAWGDRQAQFNERAEAMVEAENKLAESGGGLIGVMDELGVKIFDAEGKMRPTEQLLRDMYAALEAMPDGAKKAAILGELGWEDLAKDINDNVTAVEALATAQDLGLIPSEKVIEAFRKMKREAAETQLQFIGTAITAEEQFGVVSTSADKLDTVNERLGAIRFILQGLMTDMFSLQEVWAEVVKNINEQTFDEIRTELLTTFGVEQGFAEEITANAPGLQDTLSMMPIIGPIMNMGNIPTGLGFQHGGSFVVGGSGGPDSQRVSFNASPGERVDIIPPGKGGGSGGRGDMILNVYGNINGVDDLRREVRRALDEWDRGTVSTGVK